MSDRVVVIAGGFGILGNAVASDFLEKNYKVACIDFSDRPANLDLFNIGGMDLADNIQASQALDAVEEKLGGISVLVNVAGGFIWETLHDGGPHTWERMFRMNVLTCLTMCQLAVPRLLRMQDAAIINIGALAALKADAGMGAYTASKSAVARLTESLAAELADQDITVNAVLPSIIDTPTNRVDMPDADVAQWVKSKDIASVISFLASKDARAISGALIPVSRGSGLS